jgi:hypothetical protein
LNLPNPLFFSRKGTNLKNLFSTKLLRISVNMLTLQLLEKDCLCIQLVRMMRRRWRMKKIEKEGMRKSPRSREEGRKGMTTEWTVWQWESHWMCRIYSRKMQVSG